VLLTLSSMPLSVKLRHMNATRVRTVVHGALLLVISASPIAERGTLEATRAVAAQTATTARVTSRMTVTVPHFDAELVVEGRTVPGSGLSREAETPPLERGVNYKYSVAAKWQPNPYTTMTRTKIVSFRAGEPIAVDLTVEDPADRVRVVYVPTPEVVVAEMIKLAGVGPADVVFEPGCGDARITIAAVKAGARKGVGIDIDHERVVESRGMVKNAGLDDRIEIREGDALDIRDLSEATVVFLYMGDHFNLLIRPHLWRELKVGARVVSHRFTMGDWKPDRTASVDIDGLLYELHLWTVTEELKRRLERR
jgi:uncharacterized protein (TIGR03000 family)